MAISIATLKEQLRAATVAQRGQTSPPLAMFLENVAVLLNELEKPPAQSQPEPPLLKIVPQPQPQLIEDLYAALDDQSLTSRAKLAGAIGELLPQDN